MVCAGDAPWCWCGGDDIGCEGMERLSGWALKYENISNENMK